MNPIDVTKLPAQGAAAIRAPATTTTPAEPGSQSPANIAAIADRADIRPLDIPAALQILLAEVRAAFDLQALQMGGEGSAVLDTPPQAARALVELVVQSMPDEAGVPAWTAALVHVETALPLGLERAIDAVSAWRDVPVMVVDATKETRALVTSILGDDPQNPVWLRPEWAGLQPKFERFWRRRRIARRRLTDPDYSSETFEDGDEPRS
jgi:hypothetical protein